MMTDGRWPALSSSHIIGPALFGIIYMKTVANVPGAFYLLQCAALFTSLVLLMFVRLRRQQGQEPSSLESPQGATVSAQLEEDFGRGRGRES